MNQEAAEIRTQVNPELEVKLTGRILWLTKDPELLRQQLEGRNLDFVPQDQLAEKVSTDEIIPSRYCLYLTPEELGQFALTGFRGGVIKPSDIKNGGYEMICVGPSFGCGSSREHAPISLKGAGIRFISAQPIERIFLQNSQNQGLYPIENPQILSEFLNSKKTEKGGLTKVYEPISADIICFGGLLPYIKARLEGQVRIPEIETGTRPMTMAEKIIAKHMITESHVVGVPAVKPNDIGFIRTDLRYGYELSTPLGEAVLKEYFGDNFQIEDQQTVILFADHTALLEAKTPEIQEQISKLLTAQRRFAQKNKIQLYPPDVGICHNVVVENHALPGQVIFGTDSHTCSAGAVGAFANGLGATEMAGAWITRDARIRVPATWRFNFIGQLKEGVMAKDVMLYILAMEQIKRGGAVGKVFEYGGKGLDHWPFDELFVLPNMAVEGGAFTGIVEPNGVVINFLARQHPEISRQVLESLIVRSDPDAEFEEVFKIDLAKIPLMVATPGDPRNGVQLSEVLGEKIDVVYIGSCTGGKIEDLIKVAKELEGKNVKVPTYVQASSLTIRLQAEKLGLISAIENAGAVLIGPGCGDCCNLGMGIAEKGQKIVSDTNRNFPGRMGPANVYLANPAIVAASAILGRIASPEEL
jgi:3-isopropylmalate/(R)-2-methylmalate dehydratase large subunit